MFSRAKHDRNTATKDKLVSLTLVLLTMCPEIQPSFLQFAQLVALRFAPQGARITVWPVSEMSTFPFRLEQ